MKQYISIVIISLAVIFSGCEKKGNYQAWRLLFSSERNLVGVRVQQNPDSGETMHTDKHPAMVIYVFSDNKAHQVSFTPDGYVDHFFSYKIKPDDLILETMTKLNDGESLKDLKINQGN